MRVLALVSVLTLALPLLVALTPPLITVLPPFWFGNLILDLYTTHRFYNQNPEQFKSMEKNKAFIFFVEKLGFPAAAVAFIALVDVPFTMLLAFALMPPVYTFITGLSGEPYTYLSAALGVTGFTHLQAAIRNLGKETEAQKRKRFNELLVDSARASMDFGDVVLKFLELGTPFRKEEIAEKPEVFADQLEELFGVESARIIEDRIVENLYSTLNMEYETVKGGKFQELVGDALEIYLKKHWRRHLLTPFKRLAARFCR
jgi:hypothetical protein